MANDNINSFEKCQRKPPGTFPCQSVGASNKEPSSLFDCCMLLLFVPFVLVLLLLLLLLVVVLYFLPPPLLANSNKRTTNVVGVTENGNNGGGYGRAETELRPAKETHSSRFHLHLRLHFPFSFSFPLKQITQKMSFCRKDKASQAPGIVNILFRFLSNDSPAQSHACPRRTRYIKGLCIGQFLINLAILILILFLFFNA